MSKGPTKAQRRVLEALADGAVLRRWSLAYWWALKFPNGTVVTVDPRTVQGCWAAGLIDSEQPATMGLTTTALAAATTTAPAADTDAAAAAETVGEQ